MSQAGPELVAQAEGPHFHPYQAKAEPLCLPLSGRAAAGQGVWRSGSSRGSCLPGWVTAPGSPPGAQLQAWLTVVTEQVINLMGVCGTHSPVPRTAPHWRQKASPALSISCPCSIASCTGSGGPSDEQKLPTELSCTSGKEDTKPHQHSHTWHRTSMGRLISPRTLRSYHGSSMPM